jgi:methylglyoxal synthase
MDERLRARQWIGLVAHDHRKDDLAEWAIHNRRLLASHDLIATATTGTLLEEALGVGITKL